MSQYTFADLEPRFLARIRDDEDAHWIWAGTMKPNGYGEFGGVIGGTKRKWLAHRAVYLSVVGPIPTGMQLDHLCRVRARVNPNHLEVVTPAENTRRGENWNREKSTCKHGHPLTGDNVRLQKSGQYTLRQCRACQAARQPGRREKMRAYKAKNRERINAQKRAAYALAVKLK